MRNLSSALQDPSLKTEATEALRGLIAEVRMMPDDFAPDGHHIELVGELAGILGLEDLDTTKPAHIARAGSITLVAGGGIGLWRTFLIVAWRVAGRSSHP